MVTPRLCFYCGRTLSRQQATKDHVRPRSKGGSDAKTNKVDCCRRCNEEKGCLTLDEYRAVCAYRLGIPVSKFRFHGEWEKGKIHPASELVKPVKAQKKPQPPKSEVPQFEVIMDLSEVS